jgi:hypothetical protein
MTWRAWGQCVPFLAAAVLAAACSDPSGPEVDSNVQVRAFSRGLAERSGGSTSDVNSLEIERVYVVLGRVKLETAGDGTSDFTDERSLVIELGQGQGPVLAVTADVPAGTYKELELAIDKLEPGHLLEQSMIDTYPGLRDASILLEGTITLDGSGPQDFTFAAALDVDLEVIFAPPLTISSPEPGSTLLSLVLDASGWFYSPTGELVNPLNEANRSVIEAAIQKSIELFEDPERDGRR